jgi:hypothetical protein
MLESIKVPYRLGLLANGKREILEYVRMENIKDWWIVVERVDQKDHPPRSYARFYVCFAATVNPMVNLERNSVYWTLWVPTSDKREGSQYDRAMKQAIGQAAARNVAEKRIDLMVLQDGTVLEVSSGRQVAISSLIPERPDAIVV